MVRAFGCCGPSILKAMATACMLGKSDEAAAAMKELNERAEEVEPESRSKLDYWITTGEPRVKNGQC